MCMGTDEVVKRFAARQVNIALARVEWSASRVYCHDDVIYSYGSHFPMAKFLGEVNGKPLFVKNGDRYSVSTGKHQSDVQRYCKGPTVSRDALRSANIFFEDIVLTNIIDFRPDLSEYLYRDTETGKFYKNCERYDTADFHVNRQDGPKRLPKPIFSDPYPKPRQGQWIPYKRDDEYGSPKVESGVWHCLGAVALVKNGEYFLASLDEQQYFISQLPEKPENVTDAFRLLQPPEVQRAVRRKLAVKRQGEWFFVPTGLDTKEFRFKLGLSQKAFNGLARIAPLPERPLPVDRPAFDRNRNRHVCRQHFVVNEGIFACGVVRHRDSDNHATREHKPLNLGDEWHKAYINTEIASWTVGGRFD